MHEIADGIEASLRAVGTAKRAEGEKLYLRSDLDFTGATVTDTRAAVKEVDAGLALDHDGLIALVAALWSKPVFERRLAAIVFLQRHPGLVTVTDLPLLERLVRESRTWALVDYLAGDVLGRMVIADPDGMTPVMDRWATDDDFWVRRSSLLCELRPIRAGAALDRFLARADPMLERARVLHPQGDRLGPARGREASAGRRRVVARAANRRASGVTMREAVKYLPPADAERLMTAYRQKRPAA